MPHHSVGLNTGALQGKEVGQSFLLTLLCRNKGVRCRAAEKSRDLVLELEFNFKFSLCF